MTQHPSQIAIVGLATMGQNFALNLARNGIAVTVFNITRDLVDATMARKEPSMRMVAANSHAEVVATLERPRKILLLVRAGSPVDETIAKFLPHLEPGDMIIDSGNSHPDETERRGKDLAAHGVRFVGMGISGGEEGALHGPSLMPGCDASSYAELAPMLQKVAAKVEDGPCVTHVGTGAAGHFVKMVHNGIEYGDMQLIAEAYDLLQQVGGLTPAQMGDIFAEWNRGPLESFLVEITARILRTADPRTGKPIVDVIVDSAGQKGTGRWTSEIALRHGVPLPTIHAAVEARCLSARRAERAAASRVLQGPAMATASVPGLVDAVRDALYCSKICSYAQGLDLLTTVDAEKGFGLDLGEVARIWKGGCIIRARFLTRIQAAYRKQHKLPNLVLDEELGGFLQQHQAAWRKVVALAAERGVPVLAMGASLSWYDSFRRERLPQNLTQAQRDLFGAHTFERVDEPAGTFFHHAWK